MLFNAKRDRNGKLLSHGVKCDGCGKFANNEEGEYTRADGTAGYINAPDSNKAGSVDFCDECKDAGMN